MSWTYSQLKAAIGQLSPTPPDVSSIAAAINAQMQQTAQNLQVSDIEKILVPTGELYAITQTAAKTPSGSSPPTAADQVIAAAWAFSRMLDRWVTIETSTSTIWTACSSVMSDLETAGLLSAASVTAIGALQLPNAPVWEPAVTVGDVQTAEAQP